MCQTSRIARLHGGVPKDADAHIAKWPMANAYVLDEERVAQRRVGNAVVVFRAGGAAVTGYFSAAMRDEWSVDHRGTRGVLRSALDTPSSNRDTGGIPASRCLVLSVVVFQTEMRARKAVLSDLSIR